MFRSRWRLPAFNIGVLVLVVAALTLGGFAGLSGLAGPLVLPEPSDPAVHSPPPALCDGGFAGVYPCENIDFLASMTLVELGGGLGAEGANLWGWTDPETGLEYVLFGLTDTTAFVDISDSVNPVLVGELPGETIPSDSYRDLKVYNDHAFIIADFNSLHGMQVFDLTQLRSVVSGTLPVTFTTTAHFDQFGNAHNIFINEDSGFAYVLRTTTPTPAPCAGAMYMLDLQNPSSPSFAGCFDQGGLASDAMCVNYHGPDPDFHGREVCVIASDDDIWIADVTDKSNPVPLRQLIYNNIGRAHNAWLTNDHRYFVSSDMNDELIYGENTRILIWDFSDVDDPQLLSAYVGPTAASDHNVWVKDQQAYIGNFRAGLRILDIFDIASGNLAEAAYFDLVPADDNPGHSGGAWAVYPYFGSGVIAVSDKIAGLFLLEPHLKTPKMWFPFLAR